MSTEIDSDIKELERKPRSVNLLTEDLKNSVPLKEKYNLTTSYIARYGADVLFERLLQIVPEDFIVKDYSQDMEECSIRYTKRQGEIAKLLENVFACRFSSIGRCAFHVGVEVLTEDMNKVEKNEEKLTGDTEDKPEPGSSPSKPQQ